MASVPIIDIGDLRSPELSKRQRVADDLGHACETIGFLTVVNHGISQDVVDAAFEQMERVFALPDEVKLKGSWSPDHQNRGYEPVGHQKLDAAALPDAKEAWTLGPEHLVGISGPMQQGNVWPELDGFREPIERYHLAAMDLCERLLEAMALSLGLPEGYFAPFHQAPVCTLRLLHYLPRPAEATSRSFGAGDHTDWGAVTVLAQDDSGSLEVLDETNTWVPVPPEPGAFVINVGDMLQQWTNDRYVSTRHRVLGVPGRERYSMACFHDLDHEAILECLPTCCSPDNPARYEPTTAGAHLQAKYAASMAID